jgi:hypothetical protein
MVDVGRVPHRVVYQIKRFHIVTADVLQELHCRAETFRRARLRIRERY